MTKKNYVVSPEKELTSDKIMTLLMESTLYIKIENFIISGEKDVVHNERDRYLSQQNYIESAQILLYGIFAASLIKHVSFFYNMRLVKNNNKKIDKKLNEAKL